MGNDYDKKVCSQNHNHTDNRAYAKHNVDAGRICMEKCSSPAQQSI